jgi:TPR repeat protein
VDLKMFYPVTNSNLATSFHRNESSSGISQEEMQVAIGRARDIENIGYKNQSPQFITEAQRSYSALFWENGNKVTTEIFGNDAEVKAGMHYTSLLKKYGKSIAHFLYGKVLLASPHIRDFEKKAIKQLEYARQEGCEHADQSLQEMYLVGMGIHANSSHALEVLTLRAQLRCPASSFQLGLLYLEGKLVAQDNDKALELFKVAVEEKHKEFVK